LRAYTILKYKQLYKERNDTIKEFLCSNGLSELKNRLDLALTQKIIDWSNKQYPTSFDKYLLDNRLKDNGYYRYDYNIEGANGKNGLLEVKGTILLGQHKLKDALEIYKLIPEDEQWRSAADPFTSRISDCRDCDFRDRSQKKYTHKALVQAILDYEQKLKTDPGHAMEYHRLLGNVYYNLTHFGNATEGLRFYHDCDRFFNWDAEKYKKTGIINFDVDCSRAKEHYLQAMSLAEANGNIELAAECCFMAAKCEQNEYYVTIVNDDEKYTTKNKLYKNYFKLMKERFAKTQFYARAIKECMYFNNFASRN
jgi:hypothetical protein